MASYVPVVLAIAFGCGAAFFAPLSPTGRALDAIGIIAVGIGALHDRGFSPGLRALILLTLVLGAADAYLQTEMTPLVRERIGRFSGTILGDIRREGAIRSFDFAADAGPTLRVTLANAHVRAGERMRLRGRILAFDVARNPGEPDGRMLAHERGLDGLLTSVTLLRRLPARNGWHPREWLASMRGWALHELHREIGEPYAGMLAGELWGERGDLDDALRNDFTTTGTVHILITAGLHLGALALLLLALVEWLALPRAWACALVIVVVWMYVAASGAHLPSLRAATMLSFALLARALGRRAFSWNSLAIAALCVFAARPQSATSLSFALSFSCVGAILRFASPLAHLLRARLRAPERLAQGGGVALATQIGTWPLIASGFSFFAPYGLLANLLVVPLVGGSMLLGAMVLALSWSDALARGIAHLATWPLAWTLAVVHTIAQFPAARFALRPPPVWAIALYDASLLLVLPLWRRGATTLALALLLVSCAALIVPPRGVDRRLRIVMLDVGQGEGIVVRTPAGHTLLIDAGGRMERGVTDPRRSPAELVGQRVVVGYLLRHGIRNVDAIILSHPHGDHVGGAAPTIRACRVGMLIDAEQHYGGSAYQDALRTARKRGIPLVRPQLGSTLRFNDGVSLTFLTPLPHPIRGTKADVDENSLVVMLAYHHFHMLFNGDMERQEEAALLRRGVNLRADVLKVPHHGSGASANAAFLAAVDPRVAVISVGRYNHYGEPAPQTLALLRAAHIPIFRTDRDGAITIATDGRTLSVESFLLGRRWHEVLLR